MEPFKQAFNTFKSTIENIKVEIAFDHFIAEDDCSDSFSTNNISEIYSRGEIPYTERYDIRINGIYHRNFIDELEEKFDAFRSEIKNNQKVGLLAEKLPSYFKELRGELMKWNERISEREVQLKDQKYWIYLDKNIDRDFLSSEGLSETIITNLSDVFLFQKNRIIEILEHDTNISFTEEENSESIDGGEEEPEKIGALDIYQSALLFDYLRKHGGIQNHTSSNLSPLIHSLTGHSAQNLRTDKGFGVMAYIKSDKAKNKNYDHIPNYNLINVKEFLNKIIDDIRGEIDKNNRS